MTPSRSFALARSPSTAGTTLLHLPPEIRLLILRYLLKKGEPLLPFLPIGNDEQYKSAFSLSAQVLRTCQHLYDEGLEILYKENILAIEFDEDQEGENYVSLFNVTLHIPEESELHKGEHSLLSHVQRCAKRDTSNKDDNIHKLVQAYHSLTRIQHVNVTAAYDSERGVNLACRLLRPLLWNKEVTMTMLPSEEDVTNEGLDSCKFLRCRSFTFSDVHPKDARAAEISEVVNGPQSIHDTFAHMLLLEEKIIRQLSVDEKRHGASYFDEEYETEIDAAYKNARTYAPEKFDVHAQKLIRLARDWNRRCADEEELDEALVKLDDYITKMGTQKPAVTEAPNRQQ